MKGVVGGNDEEDLISIVDENGARGCILKNGAQVREYMYMGVYAMLYIMISCDKASIFIYFLFI
jgi:hypothetical protein